MPGRFEREIERRERQRREEQQRFQDLCYDAWRSGRDPDDLSIDRFDALLAEGYEADEINVEQILPRKAPEHDGEGGEA